LIQAKLLREAGGDRDKGVLDLGFNLGQDLSLWYPGAMAADIRDVDPAELRLPSSRSAGADPVKLQNQIAKYGTSTTGMLPLLAYEGSDGVLELVDGVTRATRVAKLIPGATVPVEVIGKLKRAKAGNRRIGDAL
jgi:hypothetical protein